MEERILIVSKDHRALTALERALSSEGCEVEYAFGPLGDWDRLFAGDPDLLLLAAEMSAEEEWAFIRGLREVCDVPLIIIRGGNDVERRVRSLRLGADDYVGRTMGIEELKARIQAILRRRSGSLWAVSDHMQKVGEEALVKEMEG